MKIKIKILFILLFFVSNLAAQNNTLTVKKFGIKEGLSQNHVNCVMQDRSGIIWIGTQDGLNKYNGYEFETYRYNSTNFNSLSSNYINCITEDDSGNIWIATQDGLNKYNPQKNIFTLFSNNPKDTNTISKNFIYSVFTDKNNNIWALTNTTLEHYDVNNNIFEHYPISKDSNTTVMSYNNLDMVDYKEGLLIATKDGLIYFDTKQRKIENRYTNELNNNNTISSNQITSIYKNKSGEIWIGTENGLNIFTEEKFKRIYYNANKTTKSENIVYSVHEDNTGFIWVGTVDGLKKVTSDKTMFIDIEKEELRAQANSVSEIYEDFSGILWCSTKKGLLKIDNRNKNFNIYNSFSYQDEKHSDDALIYAMTEDFYGNIWIASNGITKIDKNKKNRIKYNENNKQYYLPKTIFYSTFIDKYENIWAGSGNGLIYIKGKNTTQFIDFYRFFNIENKNEFGSSRVSSIKQDANGIIWIATTNGLFEFRDEDLKKYSHSVANKNSIISDKIKSMIIDQENNIWLGTVAGLTKYNPKTNNFTHFTKEEGLAYNSIMSILETSDYMWIGTEGGLSRLDKKNNFKSFSSGDTSFINDCFYGILEDNKHNLWLSSNHGLSKFNIKTEEVTNFTIENGLQAYEYNIGAYCKTKSGELIFGGLNGLNYFDPNLSYNNDTDTARQTIITKIRKKGSDIPLDSTQIIELKHDEDLQIFFTIPEYSNPKENTYKYRIKGKKWTKLGKQHYTNITGLPPGEYTFEVIGKNSNGNENNISAKLKFKVIPKFWQRTSVLISIIIIIFILSLGFFSFVLFNSIRRKKILQEKNITLKELDDQKIILEEKDLNTTDSMNYAKRIINALIPPISEFEATFKNSFVLHMSKDIVSGDFYWFEEDEKKIYVAAIDCTGHGIPGSFMSILGINLFREMDQNENDPAVILNKMNRDLKFILQKRTTEVQDSMDLSFCVINKEKKTVAFSGAKNPLYLIRDEELTQFRADRFAIGEAKEEEDEIFTSQKFTIRKNDVIYLFTDGYADQFGGMEGKKFKFRRFRRLLLDISNKPFAEQKEILESTINKWRDKNEQVDDILIIGFKPLSMNSKDNFRTTYDLIKRQK